MSLQLNPNWYDTEGSGRPILSDYAEDRTADAIETLSALPKVLAEVALDDEQAVRAAAALDMGTPEGCIEFAHIFRGARDAYVSHLIEQCQNERPWMGECEAAEHLQQVYA